MVLLFWGSSLLAIEIATGERLEFKEKKISITPPHGWEVHRDYPNLSLLLQVPYSQKLQYQRTIQIMSFKGKYYIDDITAEDFKKKLIKKYSKASQSVKNYSVRNHLITKMADGRPAILFYTSFMLEHLSMMQAHLLLASKSRAYLITYTDLESHFEGDASTKYLTEAWTSMTSLQISGETPTRLKHSGVFGGVILVLLLFAVVFFQIKRKKASSSYSKDALRDELEGDEEVSHLSQQSAELLPAASEQPSEIKQEKQVADSSHVSEPISDISHGQWNLDPTNEENTEIHKTSKRGNKKNSDLMSDISDIEGDDEDVWH